jgi:NAD(P)-dependent dehydrogenase (short-subunit alcohol dehydrogenase family)
MIFSGALGGAAEAASGAEEGTSDDPPTEGTTLAADAGQAAFRPLLALTDADFALGLNNKLMGQVNLVRFGIEMVTDGGSFTLTSGILSRMPMPGGAAISPVNAALEGFGRAAALELPRGQRINVIAPGWVNETLIAFKMDPSIGLPAAEVAKAYVRAVEGNMTGQVFDAVLQPVNRP